MVGFEELYRVMSAHPDLFTPLSDSDLKRVQSLSLEVYLCFQAFCQEHGLTVMLGGGSVLGAIRHGGFIPWDDDIDVFMPRADYDVLLYSLYKELPANMYLCAPNGPYKAEKRHAVLFDATKSINEDCESDYRKCIGIDIFPLENYPSNSFIHKIKWSFYLLICLAATTTRLWHDRKIRTTYNQAVTLFRRGRIEYKLRLLIGSFFSFLPYNKWLDISDRFISRTKPSGKVYIPSIFGSVNNPVNSEVMLPPIWGVFDGVQVLLPHNPKGYLEYEYGDWWVLPPIEKRRQHNYELVNDEDKY
jgi:lipopolysaccharide cholinephosphotransferase